MAEWPQRFHQIRDLPKQIHQTGSVIEVRAVGPFNIHRHEDLRDVVRIFVTRYFVLKPLDERLGNSFLYLRVVAAWD